MSSSNEASTMDWQNGVGSILGWMKHLLETGEQSDVEFLVGQESDDDEEKPQLFKAHKFLLNGWDVFAAQFRTNESNNLDNEPIRVIDITPSAFKAMLNFLYMNNDDSLINSENYLEVYSAAKKYLLQSLIEKCHELAPKMLTLNNSIAIWKEAKLQEDKILIEHCLHFLDVNFVKFNHIDDIGFCSWSQAEIGELFTRDTLKINHEISIFHYLNYWADKQCKDAGIDEPTGLEKRAKIGDLINAIRFPLIQPKHFAYIVPTGILTAQEVAALYVHYDENANDESKQLFPMPFSAQPRAIPPGGHNKLVDKDVVELEKARLLNGKAKLLNKNQRLKARVTKANERFRARGMPAV